MQKYILAAIGAFSATSSILVLIFFIINPLQLTLGSGPKNEYSKVIAEAASNLYHNWTFVVYIGFLSSIFFIISFLAIRDILKEHEELAEVRKELDLYRAKNL